MNDLRNAIAELGFQRVEGTNSDSVWKAQCESVQEALLMGVEIEVYKICDRKWKDLVASAASPQVHLPWLQAWLD